MATGDITAISILGSTDYNGFALQLTVEGLTAATVAYDAALDSDNNPTANTPYIDLTSEGYDEDGNLGTVARRVYLTRIMRKAYPNQADLDVTDSSGDAVIKFALSEDVYDDDTAITLTMPAGRVSDGSNSNNAASGAAVTNNSVLDYPTAFGQWDNEGIPGAYRVQDDFTVGFMGRHTRGVACVRLDATGASSAHNQNETVAAQSGREWSGSGLFSNRYAAEFPIAGFTQGEAIALRARVYPKVGDADSVFDTDDWGASEEVLGYTPVNLHCDKTGALVVYAVVDPAGNDGTGVASATLATAEASPYATIGGARADNATVIYLNNGTHGAIGSVPSQGGPAFWVEVYPHPSSTPGAVYVTIPDSSKTYRTARMKFGAGITVRPAATGAALNGEDTNYLWFDGCVWDRNSITTNSTGVGDKSLAFYVTNCTGDLGPKYWQTDQFSTRRSTIWQRGCDFTEESGDDNGYIQWYSWVGNKNSGQLSYAYGPGQGPSPYNDGALFESNLLLSNNRAGAAVFSFGETGQAISVGISIQGNVIEKLSNSSSALIAVNADTATTANTHNILVRHNTFAGERANMGYNSTGSTRYERLHWSIVGNAWEEFNNKGDDFGTGNAARTGGWPVAYGVNIRANHHETVNFDGPFGGLNLTIGDLDYTDDNSGTGDQSGGGDYTPVESDDIVGRLTEDDLFLAVDLFGNAFGAGGNIGAIQPEPAAGGLLVHPGMSGGMQTLSGGMRS